MTRSRRDTNETRLLTLAERLGAAFVKAPPLDGWLHFRGVWMPVEIKRPEVEGHVYEYTPAQRRFFGWCQVRGARWFVWRTEQDVLRDLGARQTA
jgi:hypothetical protein